MKAAPGSCSDSFFSFFLPFGTINYLVMKASRASSHQSSQLQAFFHLKLDVMFVQGYYGVIKINHQNECFHDHTQSQSPQKRLNSLKQLVHF